MSEYWISTPKYWCKHCSVFVRDTKLEKANHEVTGKHQGNLKRFLRELHRGNERDKRESERAKNEVARLNGHSTSVTGAAAPAPQAQTAPRVATLDDRKRQMAQLAALGVEIPQEYREAEGNSGGWTVVSERPIYEKEDEVEVEAEEIKGEKSVGVKRKVEEEEEEEYSSAIPAWRATKNFSRMRRDGDGGDDLDVLLGGVGVKKEGAVDVKREVKLEKEGEGEEGVKVKEEPDFAGVKHEAEEEFIPVFKKRKAKA